MPKKTVPNDDAIRSAVQRMAQDGTASLPEIVRLSGRSRQIVRYWIREIEADTIRDKQLAKAWQRALRG